MTLKTVAGGQTDNAKLLTNEFGLKNKTPQSAPTAQTTAPLAADKQFGANFLGNFNRAGLERKFAAQQQQHDEVQPNADIKGITTETVFQMPVSKGESQASVLRRAYEAAADRAGLSTEPDGGSKKTFVEDRLKKNTDADGTISINNTDTKKHANITPKEWSTIRTLNFRLTDNEVKYLKELKGTENFNAGTKAADDIARALELGNRGIFDKLTSRADASTELAKALNTVRANGSNYDFQQGLLSGLGADKILRLEKMLNGDFRYNSIIREALSTTGMEQPDKQDRTADLRREIGEKSSLDALVRLTGDKTFPMDKNFLVGAGKRVTTKGVGWNEVQIYNNKTDELMKFSSFEAQADRVLQMVAQNKGAAAELLGDAEFVKNGLRMSNMKAAGSDSTSSFAQVIAAGTSGEAKAQNPEKVEKAIILLAETIGDADSYRPQDLQRIVNGVFGAPREKVVSEKMANTLAKVVSENPQIFFRGARKGANEKNEMDSKDVQNVFTAISQYENPKRNLEASLNSQITKLMIEGADFSGQTNAKPTEIGLLIDALAKADKNATIKNASDEDKKIEMAANLFNDVAGLIPFGEMPMQNLTKLAVASTQRRLTDLAKSGTKGTYVEIEKSNLEDKEAKLKDAVNMSTLKAYEQSAFITLNNKTASPETKLKAKQFLEDIKIYNEAMPINKKILDANGRIVDPSAPATNGGQRVAMNSLAQGAIDYDNKPKAEEASRRIGNLVRSTAKEIQAEINTSYIPR